MGFNGKGLLVADRICYSCEDFYVNVCDAPCEHQLKI